MKNSNQVISSFFYSVNLCLLILGGIVAVITGIMMLLA